MTTDELRRKRILDDMMRQFTQGDIELLLEMMADIEYRLCLIELGVI